MRNTIDAPRLRNLMSMARDKNVRKFIIRVKRYVVITHVDMEIVQFAFNFPGEREIASHALLNEEDYVTVTIRLPSHEDEQEARESIREMIPDMEHTPFINDTIEALGDDFYPHIVAHTDVDGAIRLVRSVATNPPDYIGNGDV